MLKSELRKSVASDVEEFLKNDENVIVICPPEKPKKLIKRFYKDSVYGRGRVYFNNRSEIA